MIVFLIAILILEVFFLSLIERKLNKSFVTPFTILAIPYLLIILLTVFVGPKLGFRILYPQSLLYWIFGLLIFWISGVILRWIFLKNGIYFQKNNHNIVGSDYTQNCKRWIIFLAWLTLLISGFGFFVAVSKFGLSSIGQDKFTMFYGSGFTGHALVFNIIPFIFLIGVVKKENKFIILTLILIFITFFLYQVKTWVMIPMISGLLLRYYLHNIKLNIKNTVFIILLFASVFFTIYFLSIGTNFEYLKKHIFEYLFAGTLGLSEHIKNHQINQYDPFFLINPLRSLFNFITGNELHDVVQKVYVNILTGNQVSTTNVRTIFGTIFLNSSLIFGTVYIICISLIIHFLFSVFLYSHNIWIIILTTFFLGGLAMGWFDMWFNHLNFFEVTFYILLLMIVSKIQLPRIIIGKK